MFTVQVPFQPRTPPSTSEKRLEWRCNALTGERYQVEVAVPHPQLQPKHGEQPSPCPDPWNSLQHIIKLYLINLSNTTEIEEQLFQGSGVATALGCIF